MLECFDCEPCGFVLLVKTYGHDYEGQRFVGVFGCREEWRVYDDGSCILLDYTGAECEIPG